LERFLGQAGPEIQPTRTHLEMGTDWPLMTIYRKSRIVPGEMGVLPVTNLGDPDESTAIEAREAKPGRLAPRTLPLALLFRVLFDDL
jgi:hypothetical protein